MPLLWFWFDWLHDFRLMPALLLLAGILGTGLAAVAWMAAAWIKYQLENQEIDDGNE